MIVGNKVGREVEEVNRESISNPQYSDIFIDLHDTQLGLHRDYTKIAVANKEESEAGKSEVVDDLHETDDLHGTLLGIHRRYSKEE